VDAAPDVTDAKPDAIIVGCIPQEVSTRYDATWLFGKGCRADWNSSNVVTFSVSPIVFTGIEGTIAAANALTGALLAASDGIDIFKGAGSKTNSASLGANSSTSQAVAFVGKPGSTTDFFVVANSAASGTTAGGGLLLSSLECGTLVPTGAPVLIGGTAGYTEALATVRHANGTDRWVLSAASTGLAVVPVSSSGFAEPIVTPWGNALPALAVQQRAFIVFARDRRTFALTAEGKGALIGNFDSATGAVTAMTALTLPSTASLYSAAFSADATKLYFSEWNGRFWQVDRSNANATVDLGASNGALRLAIDDKIYIARNGQATLTVINNPNLPAAALSITTATLPSGCTSAYGLPGQGDL